MAYNVSFMDTTNNLYDLAVGVNTASNGSFGVVILVVVFVISFASSVRDGPITALISSGLVSTISAVLLGFMQLIDWSVVIVPIVLLFAGLITKYFQK